MSGNATIDTAVTATKAGAHDLIEKPLSGDKLLLTVQNAPSFARLHHENARLGGRARSGKRGATPCRCVRCHRAECRPA
jgi:two-component system nitrogen regulation response regulator NtrX